MTIASMSQQRCSVQGHMQTSLVKDALTMAWFRRSEAGLILHSDPGSQYCSHEFKTALMHE